MHRLLRIALALLLLGSAEVGGNTTALVSINFWLRSFQYGSGAVTVMILTAAFYVFLFVPICAVVMWRYKRSGGRYLHVATRRRAMLNGLLIAIADTWIDVASTYAASRTTVLTQVFAKSTEPILTWLLTTLVLRDDRRLHCKPAVLAAFLCIAGGVAAHMARDLAEQKHNSNATAFFIVLYFTGVLSSACYSVAQSRYMRILAQDFHDAAVEAGETPGSPPLTLIRSTALTYDMCFSFALSLVVAPLLDITPGIGYSDTLSSVFANMRDGFHCVGACPNNWIYGVITCGGWALVYGADTFMNHFSPTLNSMVNEFTSPLGVVVLMLFPSLALGSRPDTSVKAVLLDCTSLALLLVGVVTFAIVEARTTKHMGAIVACEEPEDVMVDDGGVPLLTDAGSSSESDEPDTAGVTHAVQ